MKSTLRILAACAAALCIFGSAPLSAAPKPTVPAKPAAKPATKPAAKPAKMSKGQAKALRRYQAAAARAAFYTPADYFNPAFRNW